MYIYNYSPTVVQLYDVTINPFSSVQYDENSLNLSLEAPNGSIIENLEYDATGVSELILLFADSGADANIYPASDDKFDSIYLMTAGQKLAEITRENNPSYFTGHFAVVPCDFFQKYPTITVENEFVSGAGDLPTFVDPVPSAIGLNHDGFSVFYNYSPVDIGIYVSATEYTTVKPGTYFATNSWANNIKVNGVTYGRLSANVNIYNNEKITSGWPSLNEYRGVNIFTSYSLDYSYDKTKPTYIDPDSSPIDFGLFMGGISYQTSILKMPDFILKAPNNPDIFMIPGTVVSEADIGQNQPLVNWITDPTIGGAPLVNYSTGTASAYGSNYNSSNTVSGSTTYTPYTNNLWWIVFIIIVIVLITVIVVSIYLWMKQKKNS